MAAYCAFYRDERYTSLFPNSSGKITHFVEDIECDELHTYGDYVTQLIGNKISTNSTTTHDVRTFDGVTWSGQNICIHAVRIGGSWAATRDVSDRPVFGFAFCKEGSARPFALTGMRHLVYHQMKQVNGLEPAEYDNVLGVRCLRNQYSVHRDKMMEEFNAQICPSTSTLSHRERFSLQLSFIHQACTIHKKTIGIHKKLLRSLAVEWYHRRMPRNVENALACGMAMDSFQTTKPLHHTDMCFVVSAVNVTRKDVQPFWSFASTIAP